MYDVWCMMYDVIPLTLFLQSKEMCRQPQQDSDMAESASFVLVSYKSIVHSDGVSISLFFKTTHLCAFASVCQLDSEFGFLMPYLFSQILFLVFHFFPDYLTRGVCRRFLRFRHEQLMRNELKYFLRRSISILPSRLIDIAWRPEDETQRSFTPSFSFLFFLNSKKHGRRRQVVHG